MTPDTSLLDYCLHQESAMLGKEHHRASQTEYINKSAYNCTTCRCQILQFYVSITDKICKQACPLQVHCLSVIITLYSIISSQPTPSFRRLDSLNLFEVSILHPQLEFSNSSSCSQVYWFLSAMQMPSTLPQSTERHQHSWSSPLSKRCWPPESRLSICWHLTKREARLVCSVVLVLERLCLSWSWSTM